MSADAAAVPPNEAEVSAFWEVAKRHAHLGDMPGYFGINPLEVIQPPAWAFGGTRAEADALLDLVLEGTKTATSSAMWDYQATGEPVPQVGNLSIVVDGLGIARALLVTTDVSVVPFDEVDEAHAEAEGEGDRSLAYWRVEHERFFREYADHDHDFSEQMPVVLERFEVVYRA